MTLARVLWLLALLKLVTPPFVSIPVHGSPGVLACVFGVCGCDRHPTVIALARDALPLALLAVWFVGFIAALVIAINRWLRFQKLLSQARPAPAEWQSLAARLPGLRLAAERPDTTTAPAPEAEPATAVGVDV